MAWLLLFCTFLFTGFPLHAEETLPSYLEDRGDGIPTSLFGTYIRKGELLVYPFYEYTVNSHNEYKPSELGYPGTLNSGFGLTEKAPDFAPEVGIMLVF